MVRRGGRRNCVGEENGKPVMELGRWQTIGCCDWYR